MIKFENTEVMNFEGAFRGMRNPLNSWDKADSLCGCDRIDCRYCGNYPDKCENTQECFAIGHNDLNLAQRLIKAGSDHRKFLRQIFVSVDITAPLYWWKEMDQYRVSVVSNSCSTMHKIHSKPIELSDFSIDEELLSYFVDTLVECENLRKLYIETKDKKYWRALIQLLPSGYNQKRTVTLNYETLRNIYGSRRNHKLDEWSKGFMEWIDSLPYAEELIKFK